MDKRTYSTSSRKQLRLLLLLPFAPRLDIAHGGGRVIAGLLAALAGQHKIAIVYFRGEDEPPLDENLRAVCDLAEEVIRPWSGRSMGQRWLRNGRLITSLLRLKPLWATDWASRAFGERVLSITRRWQPDIIQIEYHVMGQYLPFLDCCQAPRVLVEHEPGARAAPYLKRVHSSAGRLIHRLDKLSWLHYESGILDKIQAAVVFTDKDKKDLEAYGLKTRIYKIPFGTRIPNMPFNALGCPPLSLLFVGNFIHPPNIEAALRLACNIFPSLAQRYPELELYIVGDQPPPEVRELSREKIFITGWVPDLTDYLDRAAVFAAPLYSGGGMRVKILEALAAGKAIVATPLSIEGLNLVDSQQILLAENDAEMVDRIEQLLANPEQRTALAQRARTWACANLAWDKSIEAYESLYQELLSA